MTDTERLNTTDTERLNAIANFGFSIIPMEQYDEVNKQYYFIWICHFTADRYVEGTSLREVLDLAIAEFKGKIMC